MKSIPTAEAATPSQPCAQVLLRSTCSWDGTPYEHYPPGPPELTLLQVTLAPHTELGWHIHPTPSAAYILSGEVSVETREGGHHTLLKQGDTIAALVNIQHRARTGAAPVNLLVFYAGSEGTALSEPAEADPTEEADA